MSKPSAPLPLETIASRTLGHYQSNAERFWTGTHDHDVSQNYAALLDALGGLPSLRILDFGCGPGRDLAAFRGMGHAPVGLEGCQAFVEMARAHSGCEVLHQSFFELALEAERFDGVFANASLFHVPEALLPQVLEQLLDALVPGGVLFCSNPRSYDIDREGWDGSRYGCYLTLASWTRIIANAGFVLEHHFLRPAGKPSAEQPWLAMVWRKPRH